MQRAAANRLWPSRGLYEFGLSIPNFPPRWAWWGKPKLIAEGLSDGPSLTAEKQRQTTSKKRKDVTLCEVLHRSSKGPSRRCGSSNNRQSQGREVAWLSRVRSRSSWSWVFVFGVATWEEFYDFLSIRLVPPISLMVIFKTGLCLTCCGSRALWGTVDESLF